MHCFLAIFPKVGRPVGTLFSTYVSRRWENLETGCGEDTEIMHLIFHVCFSWGSDFRGKISADLNKIS
jgi:hypothetical protein